MKRFPVLVIVTLLVAILQPIHAGWTRTYGTNPASEAGYCVHQTNDGGYIIVGNTDSFNDRNPDLWLLKTDSLGDTLWTHTYGGKEGELGRSVQQTKDGGYIISGWTSSYTEDGTAVWMIKTDSNGDTLWSLVYTEGGGNEGHWVEQTKDGGYIVTGFVGYRYALRGANLLLLKINAQGDTAWVRTYGGEKQEEGHYVQQTIDGGFIVTGYTRSFSSGSRDLWLLKTNSLGDTLWTKIYGGEEMEEGYCVRQTSDGGYIVTGTNYTLAPPWGHAWLLKTDSAGDTLWTRTYGGEITPDWGFSLQQTNDGGYIIAGETESFGAGGGDVWLLKLAEDGDVIWSRTYGGENLDLAYSVQQTKDGGFILTGLTYSFAPGTYNYDLWMIKTDANGDTLAIADQPFTSSASFLEVLPIGRRIVMRYEDMPDGFHASVFDATGRKVDEVHATESSGMITWGKCYGPGVYFIVPSEGKASVQKVVLIK